MTQVLKDGLAHDFRSAVYTVRLERGGFRDRDDRGSAVDSGRGGVDEASAVVFAHDLSEEDGSRHIVGVVCQRDFG